MSGHAANGCGVERWAVKTGTDGDAGRVNLATQTPTTIQALDAQARPADLPLDGRVVPVETTQWVLDATLVEYKLETDSDYHLVLSDGAGHSLVAEIPFPGCVGSSPFAPGIQRARAQFDAAHQAGGFFQSVNQPVRVTGVGFFDFQHGQAGVAPNAVELHPVLNLVFNPGPTQPPATASVEPAPSGIPPGGVTPVPAPGSRASTTLGLRAVIVMAVLVVVVAWLMSGRRRRR